MPRNTPMRMPTGLELKYASATYPKPPPTIRAATSSTPIRMAIERPFRNASGSSAIAHSRPQTARHLNRIAEVSQGCRRLAGTVTGELRCRKRGLPTVFRTSRESFLRASPPIPLATVLPLPACSTFELYERLAGALRYPMLLESGQRPGGAVHGQRDSIIAADPAYLLRCPGPC